jgi:hypothetical protein
MKRSILVLLALTAGCATGVVARDVLVVPARAQGQTGPSYEYAVDAVVGSDGLEKRRQVLSRYGREGWRLAATTHESGNSYLYFERPLPR